MSDAVFPEAARFWDLDALYADLSKFCDSPLSDRDKTYLRGILCGYGAADMARKLQVKPSTVRITYLNRRLYPGLRALLDKQDIEIDYSRNLITLIPRLLEQAGYRKAGCEPRPAIRLDGVPEVETFYGRSLDLHQLQAWVVRKGCRLVSLYGLVGTGKTSLAAQFARSVADDFDQVCWRSLRTCPSLKSIVGGWLRSLIGSAPTDLETFSLEHLLSTLLDTLRQHQCLLVLDDGHSLLTTGDYPRQFISRHDDYGEFLRRIVTEAHRSTVMLVGWENPAELNRLERASSALHLYQLNGLDNEAAYAVLRDTLGADLMEEVSRPKWNMLISAYDGHPLPLIVVAKAIVDTGCLHNFFKTQYLGEYDYWLSLVYQRLSPIERNVLQELASHALPLSMEKLETTVQQNHPTVRSSEIMNACASLQERSLVQCHTIEQEACFVALPQMRKHVQMYQPHA